MIKATIIEHSVSAAAKEIVTFELEYPRFIHSEVMTHRVFSRNAMSSRAIPVAKMITQVRENPAMPVHWGKNQPGMQASSELMGKEKDLAIALWREAARRAADIAEKMTELNIHKQVANRILEPFQIMRTIVTATEWDNFWELRDHPDADPNFQALAKPMKVALQNSRATLRTRKATNSIDSWHLPYITDDERTSNRANQYNETFIMNLVKMSVARCARVSYLTHGGETPKPDADLLLYERLVGSTPRHSSPAEHQAYPSNSATDRSNNFVGWIQYRQYLDSK